MSGSVLNTLRLFVSEAVYTAKERWMEAVYVYHAGAAINVMFQVRDFIFKVEIFKDTFAIPWSYSIRQL